MTSPALQTGCQITTAESKQTRVYTGNETMLARPSLFLQTHTHARLLPRSLLSVGRLLWRRRRLLHSPLALWTSLSPPSSLFFCVKLQCWYQCPFKLCWPSSFSHTCFKRLSCVSRTITSWCVSVCSQLGGSHVAQTLIRKSVRLHHRDLTEMGERHHGASCSLGVRLGWRGSAAHNQEDGPIWH